MSSYFDDASLVMIPSGYKTSKVYSVKPTDGSGDLTFSRSNDTATRVNSAGLIEKVRTNLIKQSQAFNTTWGAVSLTVSDNTTANPLNGTVDADTLTLTGATTQKFIAQAFALNGTYTASAYLKAGTHQFIQFMLGTDAAVFANFNISAGSVGTSGGCTASIISVGNGWYRCVMTFSSTTGDNVFMLAADSASAARFSTTSSTGTFIAFGYQLELSDFGATPYIATTSAAVSVGPVANVPRLDYLNSSCPRLLLEPQRTNLAQYSEQFDNVYFSKVNAAINANALISPDGYTNADKFVATATTGVHYLGVNVTSASPAVLSVFAKAAEETVFAIGNATGSSGVVFNLSNGTITSGTGGTIENYGNGWYRCSYYRTSWTDFQYFSLRGNVPSYTGNGTDGIYIYGVQFEVGAYATSYIPTLGAAVTRGVDLAQKTSASALIGQTQGTIFWEIDLRIKSATGSDDLLNLDAGSFGDTIYLYKVPDGRIAADIYVSSVQQASFVLAAASVNVGIVKMALGYANNNSAFFVNGVQVGTTDTSCSIPATSRIQLGNTAVGESFSRTAQVLLFPTRLSNADLAALTA